ncbi:MAG: Hsp20/alpha crystallin family protein [Sedimentisphaeraceae bacterium JB056]
MLALRNNNNRSMSRWGDDFDRLFGRFMRGLDTFDDARRFAPAIDIEERDNQFEVLAELPGVGMKDIDITVNNNTLSISGEKKETTEKKEDKYNYTERYYGSFRRDLTLPENIDVDNISAEMSNGVLKVILPKTEKATPRKIDVKEIK